MEQQNELTELPKCPPNCPGKPFRCYKYPYCIFAVQRELPNPLDPPDFMP